VLVPIFRKDDEKGAVVGKGAAIVDALKARGVKARLDDREQLKPGPKFFEWEKKGVPIRIELGPRDLADGNAVLVRRDDGSKTPVPLDAIESRVPEMLDAIQRGLFERARAQRDARTNAASSMDELEALLRDPGGFVEAVVDGTDETELAIKERTKATIRLVRGDGAGFGPCILTGKPGTRRALFAVAY
jgi:prolyl-tRNA synthetase